MVGRARSPPTRRDEEVRMAIDVTEVRGARAAREAWGGTFVLGILTAVLGLFAVVAAPATGFLTVVLLGSFLAVSGIFEAYHALRHREGGNRLLFLLGGILSIVVGGLLMFRAGLGLATLTLLLAGYFIANGLFRCVTSIVDRYLHWGWDFVQGAISLLLGVIVFAQWPISALWVVGTLVGVEIFVRGCGLMLAGLDIRRMAHLRPAEA
jgi:uncharacterized membrane protein HdeD (DUF308 family)